jgi:predicted membrane-bound spermidine synthase
MADHAGYLAVVARPKPPRLGRSFLLGVFVVSGFAGLIYESVWSHYLQLFLGHAAYAQTLVLAIFMGGMALGSTLVARWSTRLRQLLLAYVIVEGMIGAFGLVFHRVFIAVSEYSLDTLVPAMSSAQNAIAVQGPAGRQKRSNRQRELLNASLQQLRGLNRS